MNEQIINTDKFFQATASVWSEDSEQDIISPKPHENYSNLIKVGTKIRIVTSEQIRERGIDTFGLGSVTGQLARVTRIESTHSSSHNNGNMLYVDILHSSSSAWQLTMKHVAEIYVPIPTINKDGNLE